MPAHLTAAEAKALGVGKAVVAGAVKSPGTTRQRRTRKAVPGHGVSRCYDCGAVFTTTAAENRHVAAGHLRYVTVLTPGAYARAMTDTDPTLPDPDDDDGDDTADDDTDTS